MFMEGSPCLHGIYGVYWPHAKAVGWRMRAGRPPHCIFWLLPLSGLVSPWLWEMVSKAARNGWELPLGSRLRDMINSYRKKLSSLLPICQLDPRRLWEKTHNFNFHSDFWDLPISWSNNQAKTIPMYICPKKTNFKTFLEKKELYKPIFHSPNVFLPLGQALGFHWQGVC